LYEQIYDPVAGNLLLSTLVAAIPILVLFVLLAGLRMAAHWASLITLAVALVMRGAGLRDADRARAQLDAARDLLRAVPYRLDRHKRHVSEVQTAKSPKTPLASTSPFGPATILSRSILYI
jgi:hypothetical protein